MPKGRVPRTGAVLERRLRPLESRRLTRNYPLLKENCQIFALGW
jgi:hypothetical protein